MRIGKNITLSVIGKEFYCRYCNTIEECRKRGHRNGIWFKIRIQWNDVAITIIDGEGETEIVPFGIELGKEKQNEYSTSYEKGYKTGGGWISLKTPILTTDESETSLELSLAEEIVLSRLLNKNLLKYICFLVKKAGQVPLLEPPYSDLMPLLFTFAREKWHELPFGGWVHELPYSFQQEFTWREFSWKLPKVKWSLHYEDENGWIKVNFANKHGYCIAYAPNLRTVYVHRSDKGSNRLWEWKEGEEKSQEVNPLLWDVVKSPSFYKKLGNLVFVYKWRDEKDTSVPRFSLLPKANPEQLQELQLLNGVLKDATIVQNEGAKEIIVHIPEHGTIILNAGIWHIHQVPA